MSVCPRGWGWGGWGNTSDVSWDRSHGSVPHYPSKQYTWGPPSLSSPSSRHQIWGPPSSPLSTWGPTLFLYCWLLVVITGNLFSLVHFRTHPAVLTSSGGHRNMHRWQAGGTHPTGMLSCYYLPQTKRAVHIQLECILVY